MSASGKMDTNFTAEISKQMQVPDRIRAHTSSAPSGSDPGLHSMSEKGTDKAAAMHVPDRIMVAGSERHITREENPLQDQKYDFVPPQQGVFLRTPPRTLRLDDSGGGDDVGTSTDTTSGGQDSHSSSSHEDKRLWNANKKYNGSVVRRYADDMDTHMAGGGGGGGDVSGSGAGGGAVGSSGDLLRMRRQMDRLHERVAIVEQQVEDQRTRETVAILAFLGFVALRMLSWIRAH